MLKLVWKKVEQKSLGNFNCYQALNFFYTRETFAFISCYYCIIRKEWETILTCQWKFNVDLCEKKMAAIESEYEILEPKGYWFEYRFSADKEKMELEQQWCKSLKYTITNEWKTSWCTLKEAAKLWTLLVFGRLCFCCYYGVEETTLIFIKKKKRGKKIGRIYSV